jgi:hypothetical protein
LARRILIHVGSPAGRDAFLVTCQRDLDGPADREPANASADVVWSVRELALDGLASLAEVLPALVVDRDRCMRPNEAAELDASLAVIV